MRHALSCARAAIVLASALAVPAQTIWSPPSGSVLDPWFAGAAPGDIIQLNGVYHPFTLTKGLTLISPNGPSVVRRMGTTVLNCYSQIAVPAGQRARLVGLHFDTGFTPSPCGHWVSTNGDVSFEDCRFNAYSMSAALTVYSGTVILQRCHMLATSNGHGMFLSGGTCTMTDCLLRGGAAFTTSHPGYAPAGQGLRQMGGTLIASRIDATGGAAAPGSFPFPWEPASPAVICNGGTTWLTDSTLTGGSGLTGTAGAPALTAIAPVSIARTTLTGGAGTATAGPSTGFVVAPQLVGMAANGPVVRGSNAVVVATAGSSQQLLGIVGSFDSTPAFVPPIVEPLFGAPASLVVLGLAIPTAGAPVQVTLAVPNVASLYGSPVWFQAVQLDGAQVRASTLVGGCIR